MTGVEILTITATPAASLNGTSINNTASVTLNTTTTQSNTVTTAIGTVAPPPGHICYLAGVPGDGTATTFITNLYRELLGREPDAASLPGWVNYVQQNGVAGQVQVIRDFMNSAEYKAHYVTCLYEAFLNRAPDAGGLQFWTQKMGNPGTPTQNTGSADEKSVLAAIVGSRGVLFRSWQHRARVDQRPVSRPARQGARRGRPGVLGIRGAVAARAIATASSAISSRRPRRPI